jgi:hypothetical protein
VTATDYTECGTCHARVIWPVDEHGTKQPPADYGEDLAGPMAIQHLPNGTWLARWAGVAEVVRFPEKRHRRHVCAAVSELPGTGA